MPRPRIHNTHLPKGVQLKHGAYYLIFCRKWFRLCDESEFDKLPEYIKALKLHPVRKDARTELLKGMRKRFPVTRQNAKNRKLEFQITMKDVEALLEAAGWRCAVTQAEFSDERINGKRPFLPSIDRIDSTKGYIPGNCRIVCYATNLAMNAWGDGVLKTLMHSFHATKRGKHVDSSKDVDIPPQEINALEN